MNTDALNLRELLAWSWEQMPRVHRNPWNFVIHIITAPLFLLAHLLVLLAMLSGNLAALFMALVSIATSIVCQQFGHLLEKAQQTPYASTRDAIRRFYIEQCITIWRYLFSGTWLRSS